MRDEHMRETICLVRKEIAKKAERRRLSFGQFLLIQIRFVGWKIWMIQIVVLGIIYLGMTEYFGKYYAEHPELLEELERQYNERGSATEEDRYLEDLENCIIAFSEYSIDEILAKLDKNSSKVRSFFLQDSIRHALLKKRKLRKAVAVKYGKNYLRDLGR